MAGLGELLDAVLSGVKLPGWLWCISSVLGVGFGACRVRCGVWGDLPCQGRRQSQGRS